METNCISDEGCVQERRRMSQKARILRSLVEQRLTAAAEEIFGLFEKTIVEYEEELCRTKEENQRQRQILDCVWNPRVVIHKTDIQQLSVVKQEVPPEQQEVNSIVHQEEPEPEPRHIKEEYKDLWTSQDVYITKLPSTPVPVKNEDDEEKLKSSQLNQTQTEGNKLKENIVDCGGSEPSISFHPQRHLQRKIAEQNEDSEETEDSDEDQTLNHTPESKLPTNSSTEQLETQTDGDDNGGSEPDIIFVDLQSIRGRTGDSKSLLEEHMDTHTGQKLVGSTESEAAPRAMMLNTDRALSDVGCEKLYNCSLCLKTFSQKSHLEIHMRIHTGEKPLACSLFTQKSSLRSDMTSHTGEKRFKCSLCHKRFGDRSKINKHMRVHIGEKPFSCSLCEKRFAYYSYLATHMKVHTGEKPFSCSECAKKFSWKIDLERHMRIHTGERPFSCVVCQKSFTRKYHLQIHMKIHTRMTQCHIHRNQT